MDSVAWSVDLIVGIKISPEQLERDSGTLLKLRLVANMNEN
jgi:hypothetical protein